MLYRFSLEDVLSYQGTQRKNNEALKIISFRTINLELITSKQKIKGKLSVQGFHHYSILRELDVHTVARAHPKPKTNK